MKRIFQSASKIVFILIAVTTCAGFLLGKLEAKDFIPLVAMAFTYYFTRSANDVATPYEKAEEPAKPAVFNDFIGE